MKKTGDKKGVKQVSKDKAVANLKKKLPQAHLGRNKKRSWKRIQHDDIEAHLVSVREDERLGSIRAKGDEQLFQIDRKGGGSSLLRNGSAAAAAAAAVSVPIVDTTELKCFALLKPHSLVPDPVVKRNRLRKRGERKSAQMAAKDEERHARQAKTRSAAAAASTAAVHTIVDPWSTEPTLTALDKCEWIPDTVVRHNLAARVGLGGGHAAGRLRRRPRDKPSQLPAIALPHGGFSYNPSYSDHQAILAEAVQRTQQEVKRERNLTKAVAPTTAPPDIEVKEEEEEEEDGAAAEAEGEDEEEEKKPVGVGKKPKAKTRQSARRLHQEKLTKNLATSRKRENARLSEVYRLRSIQKEIKKEEFASAAKRDKLKKEKEERERFGQKALSKWKYQELVQEPVLSEDLSGSLVGTSGSGELLRERFKSYQERNILEPRVKQRVKRKLRLKKYQRLSAKMDWEKTGEWNGIKVL